MADGTRMKEMQTQINKILDSMEMKEAETAAQNARMERMEALLEAIANISHFSPSSPHDDLNSHARPLQMRNVKLEFPSFDGKQGLDWIFKAEQFFDFYATPDHERLPPLLPTPPTRPMAINQNNPNIKCISPAEMQIRRDNGLCYFCDDKFSFHHRYPNKHLMMILTDDDNPEETALPNAVIL